VKLCDFGFAPPPLLERFTQVIVKLCDFGFAAPPPLRKRFTQVIVKLCDFRFARATLAPPKLPKARMKFNFKNQFTEKPGKVSIRILPTMLR
jgi:hypothetical protein